MNFISVPGIVIICFLIAEFLKVVSAKNEVVKKLIPVIVGACGGIIAYFVFVYYPSILQVENILEAISVGIISGLASTGGHQIVKQLTKEGNNDETEFF